MVIKDSLNCLYSILNCLQARIAGAVVAYTSDSSDDLDLKLIGVHRMTGVIAHTS